MSNNFWPNGTTQTTSSAAAKSIKPAVGKIKRQVLRFIREQGGATCDEVEQYLELRHQTASARINELKVAGLIVATGDKRKTRSGRAAAVWRIA
jgi:predicted ArsR family transcriptional regulator